MNVHLGCWHREIPGFVNVDLCDLPHINHRSEIDNLPFFGNNTVDLIYVSHAFEYFDREHAPSVLTEWRRVLKPGGTLRIAVPDFDKLIKIYSETGKLESILGPLFGRMEINTDQGSRLLFHRTTYSMESLKMVLQSNGFADVKKYDWRDTIHRDYDDHSQAYYPHMDKEHGILLSLNIECIKK